MTPQTGSGLQIGFDANNNLVVSSGGGTLTYASTDDLWHHWAVTYDQTTSTLTLLRGRPPCRQRLRTADPGGEHDAHHRRLGRAERLF